MNLTAAALVGAAARRVRALEPAEFAAAADTGEKVVVDVREADERVRNGFIRGAVHVPRGMLEFRADPTSAYFDERLGPDRHVLLYCAGGGRSALAAETLATLGYRKVAHLRGGLDAWNHAGLPVRGPETAPY